MRKVVRKGDAEENGREDWRRRDKRTSHWHFLSCAAFKKAFQQRNSNFPAFNPLLHVPFYRLNPVKSIILINHTKNNNFFTSVNIRMCQSICFILIFFKDIQSRHYMHNQNSTQTQFSENTDHTQEGSNFCTLNLCTSDLTPRSQGQLFFTNELLRCTSIV